MTPIRKRFFSHPKGFILFETIIVFALIFSAICAGLFLYCKLSNQAKIMVCKARLINIRAALALRHMETQCQGLERWSALEKVQDNETDDGSYIMEDRNLPENPFSTGIDRDLVVDVDEKQAPQDTEGAWAYNPKTGEFWANTASGNNEADY